ncbi:hypothetical protein HNO89_003353 [Sporosarcina luteola]|nr:hypothetical protein [Sporosarcina luteola]
MKSTSKMMISMIVGLLLLGGVCVFITGSFMRSVKDTHPPCDQLPSVADATVALENHKDLIKKIENLGGGIQVEIGKPCPDDQNRGLVQVSYETKLERDSVDELLTRSEGFGVPVHLVKR